MKFKTFGTVLEENKGIGKGFDFLRVFLSVSVFFTHSFLIAEGEQHQFSDGLINVFHRSLLPMFFALSGFLITGSAMRLKLKDFILNRGIRIVPALAVDILVSAIIIGPIFTTWAIGDYFGAYEFRAYFANLLGLIHYVLPGVFEDNPFPATVNGSLWTVPFEIGCYAIMSFLIISGAIRKKWALLMISAIVAAVVAHYYLAPYSLMPFLPVSSELQDKLGTSAAHYFSERGNMLYVFFLVGCLAYQFKECIPFHPVLLIVMSVIICIVGTPSIFDIDGPLRLLILSPAFVYLTVGVGLLRIPPLPLFKHGDYSYGIYLYGYPIQQAAISLFPFLVSPWVHFAVTLPVVVAVAACSWHFIEKPILGLRRKFSFTARKGEDNAMLPSDASKT